MITPERVDELIALAQRYECTVEPATLKRTRIDDRTLKYEWVVSCCPWCGGEHTFQAGYRGDDVTDYLGLKSCPMRCVSPFVAMRDYDYKRDAELIMERTRGHGDAETRRKIPGTWNPSNEERNTRNQTMITPEYVDSLIRMLEIHKCPVAPATLVRSIEGRNTLRFDWIVHPCPHCGGQHKVFAGHKIDEAHTYLGKDYCIEGGGCEKYIMMREYDIKRDAAKIAKALGQVTGDGCQVSVKPDGCIGDCDNHPNRKSGTCSCEE